MYETVNALEPLSRFSVLNRWQVRFSKIDFTIFVFSCSTFWPFACNFLIEDAFNFLFWVYFCCCLVNWTGWSTSPLWVVQQLHRIMNHDYEEECDWSTFEGDEPDQLRFFFHKVFFSNFFRWILVLVIIWVFDWFGTFVNSKGNVGYLGI